MFSWGLGQSLKDNDNISHLHILYETDDKKNEWIVKIYMKVIGKIV